MKVAFWICTLLDLLLPLAAAAFAGWKIARAPGTKRWEYFFLAALSVFLFAVVTYGLLGWGGRVFNYRLDLYAYEFDRIFGQPSFVLGRVMQRHLWLNISLRTAYSLMFSAMLTLISAYFLFRPLEEAGRVIRTMYTGLLALPLYIAVPISGPAYAFPQFPNFEPRLMVPGPIQLIAPPNGFPSLHLTIALLILYFAWRWKAGAVLGTIYVLLIALATLGTGEHYSLDLLVALPFSALVIWLGGVNTDRVKRRAGPVVVTSSTDGGS
jgi:hypothetical protein